jgi:hypothetical protein
MTYFLQFIEGATEICNALYQAGFWADFIDGNGAGTTYPTTVPQFIPHL